ncbi:hypothetical protein D1007_04532 [Hordeum vulgare]|nr:hypothetical protein D1007_04532 [Hordeum vulgare]
MASLPSPSVIADAATAPPRLAPGLSLSAAAVHHSSHAFRPRASVALRPSATAAPANPLRCTHRHAVTRKSRRRTQGLRAASASAAGILDEERDGCLSCVPRSRRRGQPQPRWSNGFRHHAPTPFQETHHEPSSSSVIWYDQPTSPALAASTGERHIQGKAKLKVGMPLRRSVKSKKGGAPATTGSGGAGCGRHAARFAPYALPHTSGLSLHSRWSGPKVLPRSLISGANYGGYMSSTINLD